MPVSIRRFLQGVVGQGGTVLSEFCQPQVLPPIAGKVPSHLTTGCGHATLVDVPYAGEDGQTRTLTVCARCDGAISWPRFA